MSASKEERKMVAALLERHGRTYAQELGIALDHGTPAPLFQWLCAAILFSARIGSATATKAMRALLDAGWTTAEKMAASSWAERTRVLNEAGYARYDESTARMLGDTAERVVAEYGGDLRRLREQAGGDPAEERARLKAFKGLGEVGVDIFVREVQDNWDEHFPFADRKSLTAAAKLGLGNDAAALSALVQRKDYARLVAALVRAELAGETADGAVTLRQ